MTYNASSLDVVNTVLQPLAPKNAQFPLLLYNNKNCTGKRYPDEGEFGLWNQDLSLDLIGFDNILSLYVPPHAILEMWSVGDGDGYYAIQGPAIVSNTGALLAFWRHYDDSPCFPTEQHCGKRVGTNNGWRFGVDFARIRVTWNSSWVRLLHTLASNKQPLSFGGTQYNVNNDNLFNSICPHPYDRYSCQCHSAFQLILKDHFDAAENTYVNLLQNGCNPDTMYVPSQANIGAVTKQECTAQINAQLATGSFPTLDKGGPEYYICAGELYLNGIKDPESAEKNKEAQDNQSNTVILFVVIGVVVAICIFVFIYGIFYTNSRITTTTTHPTKPSIRRNRMNRL